MAEQNHHNLEGYIDQKVVHAANCGICGHSFETEYEADCMNDPDSKAKAQEEETAIELFEAGWREIDSEEYGMITIACPDCVKAAIPAPKAKLTEGI